MKNETKLKIVTIGTIIIIAVISTVDMLPNLNENQTLYFSSTLAQVSATLFGLSIAVYTFLDSKLEKDVERDDTLVDIIAELKLGYHYLLIFGAVTTGIAIILCVFNIIIGSIDNTDGFVFNYILDASFVFAIVSIASTLLFTYRVTDPKKIQKQSRKLIEEDITDQNEKDNYFTDFLVQYIELENLIVEFVRNTQNKTEVYDGSSLYKSINYLQDTGILPTEICAELNHLRKIRNNLVHGKVTFVSKGIFENLKRVTTEVNNIIKTN